MPGLFFAVGLSFMSHRLRKPERPGLWGGEEPYGDAEAIFTLSLRGISSSDHVRSSDPLKSGWLSTFPSPGTSQALGSLRISSAKTVSGVVSRNLLLGSALGETMGGSNRSSRKVKSLLTIEEGFNDDITLVRYCRLEECLRPAGPRN